MTNLLMVMPYRNFVTKAQAEGFRVCAIWDPTLSSVMPTSPRHFPAYLESIGELADEFVLTDFGDPVEFERVVRETADRFQPAHIYHVGQEASMLATYRIAEDLGKAVNPVSSIDLLNDKYAMRRKLAEHDLSPVRFALADHWRDVAGLLKEFTLPVVVKPTSLAGSRGVRLLRHPDELADWGSGLATYGYDGPILIEEYLSGDEYSVETISAGGEHHVIAVTRKVLGEPPLFVEMGHVLPLPDSPVAAGCAHLAVELLRLAGYRNGPAHTEVIWTDDGPRLVESQARLGGDKIPQLVQLATGFDIERAIFRVLAGRPLAARDGRDLARIGYLEFPSGRLRAVSGLAEAKALDFVADVQFPFELGDEIPPILDSKSRHGYVMVSGDSEHETLARLDKVRAMIDVRVEGR